MSEMTAALGVDFGGVVHGVTYRPGQPDTFLEVVGAVWLVFPMRHAKAVLAVIVATALGLVAAGAGIPYYRYRHVE